jgi:GMP synthase (glutamine-hydrolysing)
MIVYVDLEHADLRRQPALWEESRARCLDIKYRLEDVAGEPCLIARYDRVSPARLHALHVRAVVVSGCYSEFERYPAESLAGLRAAFREAAWPTLAFCGGHQLLAQAYGADIGPMGRLPPGAPEPYAGSGLYYVPGEKQERGFMRVRALRPHPLFEGVGSQPLVFQSHYWEVKSAPRGFQVLAESDLCPVQAIAHESLPLVGTQFHPEQYDAEHPDGRTMLENFFARVVSEHRARRSAAAAGVPA